MLLEVEDVVVTVAVKSPSVETEAIKVKETLRGLRVKSCTPSGDPTKVGFLAFIAAALSDGLLFTSSLCRPQKICRHLFPDLLFTIECLKHENLNHVSLRSSCMGNLGPVADDR